MRSSGLAEGSASTAAVRAVAASRSARVRKNATVPALTGYRPHPRWRPTWLPAGQLAYAYGLQSGDVGLGDPGPRQVLPTPAAVRLSCYGYLFEQISVGSRLSVTLSIQMGQQLP